MDYLKITDTVYCHMQKYNSAIKIIYSELLKRKLPKTDLGTSIFRYAKLYHNELLTGNSLIENQIWVINKFNIPLKKEETPKLRKHIPHFTSLTAKMKYWEFLQTSYWAGVRDLIFKRDKGKCVACGAKRPLVIHHKYYNNVRKEHLHLEDLETLCHDCHKFVHSIEEKQIMEQHLNSI